MRNPIRWWLWQVVQLYHLFTTPAKSNPKPMKEPRFPCGHMKPLENNDRCTDLHCVKY